MKICNRFLLKTLKTFNSITAALFVIASGATAAGALSQEATPQKRYITWDEFKDTVVDLTEKLKAHARAEKIEWAGIILVASGGLTPSHHIGKLLGIKRFQTFCTYSYEDCTQLSKSTTYDIPTVENGGKNWLVIDDIADTGKTLKIVREHLPNAYYVSLIAKPEALPVVDLYGELVAQEQWIVFPWEKLFNYS